MSSDAEKFYAHQQNHEAWSGSPYPDVVMEARLYDHIPSQLWVKDLESQLAFCAKLLASCLDRNGWIDEDIYPLYVMTATLFFEKGAER